MNPQEFDDKQEIPIRFEDLFDGVDIQRIQDEFAAATGVASIITRPDGTPITKPSNFTRLCAEIVRKTPKGCANCYKSDAVLGAPHPGGPIVQPCLSGGLWDAGASIIVGGRHIANWLIGQVRDETQTIDSMRAYARDIGADEDAFLEAFLEVPSMTRQKFGLIAQALFTFANQLSLSAYLNVQQARFIRERQEAEARQLKMEQQLRQAQKMESVGRLAGGVAHDFNNMLQAILGYTEMAMENMDSSHQIQGDLVEIRNAAQRSADLTRQLLAFARQQTIIPELLDLNEAVEGLLKMLRRLIGEAIELAWMPSSETLTVRMDPSQIDQILVNLCVNARDAISSVGRISIATGRVVVDEAARAAYPDAVPGNYVELVIRDTGCGMDQATLDHIFEPFFTTKPNGMGTGLGLATVYGIVRQNKGFIDVASKPGKGTEIRIRLPAQACPVESLKEDADTAPVPRGVGTVLLVEDERAIRTVLKYFLEGLGYTVMVAEAPDMALKLVESLKDPVDLLITDVIMPRMSGPALAERLSGTYPQMKCIFMSGYTANSLNAQGLTDASVAFLSKPFSSEALAAKVREVLTR